MALNGAGVSHEEAEMQVRAITPMVEEVLGEKSQVRKTCLSSRCPERVSVCCDALSTTDERSHTGFACLNCGVDFKGGECTAEESLKANWQDQFRMFYDSNEEGGSSRWLVSPSVVETFIKGLLE